MDIFSVILTIVSVILLGVATYWFVLKRNPAKISSQREIIEENKSPSKEELEDPLNP